MSKQDYLNKAIAEELLSHEIEHIRQSHSIDVIFIELVKIIYWFNPVLILYSRAIRVNHEYLADNGVIGDPCDIKDYADKLLNFISCNRNVPLTSGFNPSLTRKRLIMLTKSKSGRINYRSRILATFGFAACLFMVLGFKPYHLKPTTIEQNISINSEKETEKINTKITSQNKVDGSSPNIKKAESSIKINQTQKRQGKIVKGFVVNKYGKYIQGAQILVSGKKTGISTDFMGHFVLSNISEEDSLTFSYEGYVTQTQKPVFSSEMVVRFIIVE